MSFRSAFVIALRVALAVFVVFIASRQKATSEERTSDGLLAIWNFEDGDGDRIADHSGHAQPVDLKIGNPAAAEWSTGSLRITGPAAITTASPPARLLDRIQRTGAFTIEAWITPDSIDQSGPARIVSLSGSSSLRNLTLGQDGNKFDVRLRTTETSTNGIPSQPAKEGSVSRELTHVVYTRSRSGRATIFVNGEVSSTQSTSGRLGNWDRFPLHLGDEQGGGRVWKGSYHLVAIYGKALTPEQIHNHFVAGAEATTPSVPSLSISKNELRFERHIAPLLADRCLECHDASTAQGGLDLSTLTTTLKGGDSGSALVVGKSSQSLLWESVESDDMPHERDPLSTEEKELLKTWIDDGANWTLKQIDPAVYAHGGQGGQGGQQWIRRLTIDEYIATVLAVTSVDISAEARELLPADLRADGFTNTAYNLGVDLEHIEAYSQLAELIVSRMKPGEFAKRFSKSRKFTDNDMGRLIERMGTWVLRGPVSNQEVITYRGISTSVAASGGSFDEAVGFILEAMLQSPRFLYRIEQQNTTGEDLPVTEYELASRISYIVWGGPPDAELLKRAEDGTLVDPSVLDQQLERMLSDPRAVAQSQRFVADWLQLSRLDNLAPNSERFPEWNGDLATAMRQETLAFVEEVLWKRSRPMSALLNEQVTFLSQSLANHYRISDSSIDYPDDVLKRVDLSSVEERGGVLTQGALLTAGGDDASMVTRGLLVMHELMRGVVKDPPPCVDTTPRPAKPGLTQRTIAMERVRSSTCGGCHSKFEPLAFGLERYDGLGRFALKDEHDNDLRDDGEILFPGQSAPTPFASSAELMNVLAESDRVKLSLTWKLTQFCVGRPLGAGDAATIDEIHAAAQQAGGRYTDTIKAIVHSRLVQMLPSQQQE